MTRLPLLSLPLADIMAAARGPEAGRTYRLHVLRQITAEPLEPYLQFGARELGLDLKVTWGGFDTMMQDALQSGRPIEEADAVLVLPAPERLAPEIFLNAPEGAEGGQGAVAAAAGRLSELISALRARTQAPILVLGLTDPGAPISIAGKGERAGLLAALGTALAAAAHAHANVYIVDADDLAAEAGRGAFYDPRQLGRAAIPYSQAAFRLIASEILTYLRNFTGQVKKVLALDCDNTLWGGLCGEVAGHGDLQVGSHGFPNLAHDRLQRWARDLKRRGVLLTLVSKNEEENVWRVFDGHPGMVLTRDDIAAWRINWRPKSENLRELADELNVGLDSIVFLDDQPVEIDSVRELCPEITVLELDEDTLIDVPRIARRAGWFESLRTTDTDRGRTAFFFAERKRKKIKAEAPDFDSYLKGLAMSATVALDSHVNLGRAEQMCARTNQMNLTTKRYTQADLEAFVNAPDARLMSVAVRDRLGDLGVVGLAILKAGDEAGQAEVDQFLLSCRAFGRKCEGLMFEVLRREAADLGAGVLTACLLPTAKNRPARGLLATHGFAVNEDPDGTERGRLTLDKTNLKPIDVFETVEVLR